MQIMYIAGKGFLYLSQIFQRDREDKDRESERKKERDRYRDRVRDTTSKRERDRVRYRQKLLRPILFPHCLMLTIM